MHHTGWAVTQCAVPNISKVTQDPAVPNVTGRTNEEVIKLLHDDGVGDRALALAARSSCLAQPSMSFTSFIFIPYAFGCTETHRGRRESPKSIGWQVICETRVMARAKCLAGPSRQEVTQFCSRAEQAFRGTLCCGVVRIRFAIFAAAGCLACETHLGQSSEQPGWVLCSTRAFFKRR